MMSGSCGQGMSEPDRGFALHYRLIVTEGNFLQANKLFMEYMCIKYTQSIVKLDHHENVSSLPFTTINGYNGIHTIQCKALVSNGPDA